MRQMTPEWNRALTVAYETGRLFLPSPEGNSALTGIRDSRYPFSGSINLDNSIFCLGGSTTYGHGVDEARCWPALMQTSHVSSINCGMVNNDIKASLHSLVTILRQGYKPHTLIFFDGVNEKNAYKRWLVNQDSYIDFDCQYFQFQHFFHKNDFDFSRFDFFAAALLGSKYFKAKYHLQKNESQKALSATATLWRIIKRKWSRTDMNLVEIDSSLTPAEQESFLDSAVASYLDSKKTIKKIAAAYGIRECFFFLQPHIGTVDSKFARTSRSIYMERLYSKIRSADTEVIDLSHKCNNLAASMFFDWQHFDERGHEIVAKTIESEIAKIRQKNTKKKSSFSNKTKK